MRLGASLLFSFALASFMALPSSASTIQLSIDGNASVGSNYLDFGNFPANPPVYTPAPGYGTFLVSLVNPGIFSAAGVTVGEAGMIQSLNEPPSTPITLPSAFMTFDTGGSNLQLWATYIPDGTVGPFTFGTSPDGSAIVNFSIDGYVWNTTTMSKVDTFTGTFSATFEGQSVASLFSNLPIDTGYSATFTATTIPTIPEPASMLLMGAGLLGVGLVARRKARRS